LGDVGPAAHGAGVEEFAGVEQPVTPGVFSAEAEGAGRGDADGEEAKAECEEKGRAHGRTGMLRCEAPYASGIGVQPGFAGGAVTKRAAFECI
jgi:hypothetical protein